MVEVQYGKGTTKHGPGVDIQLSGNDVANAIDDYLAAKGILVNGPRTIKVNGESCERGEVYVDPSGSVIDNGRKYSGRGPTGGDKTLIEKAVEAELRRFCDPDNQDYTLKAHIPQLVEHLNMAIKKAQSRIE